MDTPQTITHISLCAGYGGIDLGLKRAIPSLRTVAFSEIEGYACANLVAKMEAGLLDPAPIWTNLKTFPWAAFRDRVDILSGGYPCQPFSAAGKRLGTEDPRHLWPFIADGIRLMQPRVCFFENVEGHISLGLRAVIKELGSLGYETTWGVFSASEVGAPHQRKRIFILAHRNDERSQGRNCGFVQKCASELSAWPSRPHEPQHGWEPPRVVGNAYRSRNEEPEHLDANLPSEPSGGDSEGMGHAKRPERRASESFDDVSNRNDAGWIEAAGGAGGSGKSMGNAEGRDGLRSAQRDPRHAAQPDEGAGCRQTQSSLGRDADGTASGMDYAELSVTCDNRTDELRLIGNGVVPDTAERAFLTLAEELNESTSLSTTRRRFSDK